MGAMEFPATAVNRPQTVEQTGLPAALLEDLALKHLERLGVTDMGTLSAAVGLLGRVVEALVGRLRREALVETRGATGPNGAVRYALTQKGLEQAAWARQRCGYVGPAPVPLDEYRALVSAQSVRRGAVTPESLRTALADVVIGDDMLERIGPALHSGRALFLYGSAGTGKSFLARRLVRAFGDDIRVPHAVWAGGVVVRLFDPAVHERVAVENGSLRIGEGPDPRFVQCRRPVVVAGGELTLDRLELQHDPASNQHLASLQMRANNGLLLLDDLGRQRVPPEAILNRWVVPMEERRDFLHTESGAHFEAPFDLMLVFSSNLAPHQLADDAFLRRIGYKVRLGPLTPAQYAAVWERECRSRGVEFDSELPRFAVEALHGRDAVPLFACYPRDIIGIAVDHCRYRGEANRLDRDKLRQAWDSFVVGDHRERV